MKKVISIALLVVCFLSFASAPAHAEEFTEIVFEKPFQIPDLMDLTVDDLLFSRSEKYFDDTKAYSTYLSGEGFRFLMVKCTLLNTSLNYYKYDEHIKDVKIVFRDKFEFEPILLQNMLEKKYPTEVLWEIQPLVSTTPIFFFKVPTLLETVLDPIYLRFTIDDVAYNCKLR